MLKRQGSCMREHGKQQAADMSTAADRFESDAVSRHIMQRGRVSTPWLPPTSGQSVYRREGRLEGGAGRQQASARQRRLEVLAAQEALHHVRAVQAVDAVDAHDAALLHRRRAVRRLVEVSEPLPVVLQLRPELSQAAPQQCRAFIACLTAYTDYTCSSPYSNFVASKTFTCAWSSPPSQPQQHAVVDAAQPGDEASTHVIRQVF